MTVVIDGTSGITAPALDSEGNLEYSGTLTGGTGVINIGSGQLVKDASGNLGLGVTPSAWSGVGGVLQIKGNAYIASASQVLELVTNGYFDGTNWRYTSSSFANRYNTIFGEHRWYTAPSGTAGNSISFTQAMTLNASGNLGIGNAGPIARLHVTSAPATKQVLWSDGTNGTGYMDTASGFSRIYSNVGLAFGTGNDTFSEKVRIGSDGALRVGTTGGWTTASSISSGTGYSCKAGSGGGFSNNGFNINWTGTPQLWIDASNIGTITTTSDYRIKKNIITQTTPALERVMQLRPVNYELADYGTLFKADGVAREGFIAHELAEVIPSAVEGEKDAENQIQSLRLDALCSVLTKAIQEQQAIIIEQQAIITDLTTRLIALEAK